MKSQKGVTLTSLVIYIVVITIIIGAMALLTSFFYSNIDGVKGQSEYVVEYNKFNMFFIHDVKSNNTAEVSNSRIEFENGIVYEYKNDSKIYRNGKEIADKIQNATFTSGTYTVDEITKNLIIVKLKIGSKDKFYEKQIEYVLKYW